MASRVQRLTVVLELACRVERTAAEAFEAARQLWQQEMERLQELDNYYRDYEAQVRDSSGTQSVDYLMRSRGFLQQLREASKQQSQIVAQRAELAERKKRDWHKAHLKYGALKDLIARLRADEAKSLSRKEEKMLDEWVQQSHSRASNNLF